MFIKFDPIFAVKNLQRRSFLQGGRGSIPLAPLLLPQQHWGVSHQPTHSRRCKWVFVVIRSQKTPGFRYQTVGRSHSSFLSLSTGKSNCCPSTGKTWASNGPPAFIFQTWTEAAPASRYPAKSRRWAPKQCCRASRRWTWKTQRDPYNEQGRRIDSLCNYIYIYIYIYIYYCWFSTHSPDYLNIGQLMREILLFLLLLLFFFFFVFFMKFFLNKRKKTNIKRLH
jgi:hypothetical protein